VNLEQPHLFSIYNQTSTGVLTLNIKSGAKALGIMNISFTREENRAIHKIVAVTLEQAVWANLVILERTVQKI